MKQRLFFTSTNAVLNTVAIVVAVLGMVFLIGCAEKPDAPNGPVGTNITGGSVLSSVQAPMIRVSGTFKELGTAAAHDEFIVTNSSDAGIKVTQVHLTFRTGATDVGMDVNPGAPGIGEGSWLYVPNGWDVGLLTWRGVYDGSKRVTMKFGLFDPGKSLIFGLDLDQRDLANGRWYENVSGNDVASSTVMIDVQGPGIVPQTLQGTYQASGTTASGGADAVFSLEQTATLVSQ